MAINPYVSMLYKVDWLSFTIIPDFRGYEYQLIDNILSYLAYNSTDFEEVQGRFFFNSGLTLGNYVNIYFNDNDKPVNANSINKVMFMFTGQGSTDLAKHLAKIYNSRNWQVIWLKFFRFLKMRNARVTRLDVALDDYHGVLDFDQMERKLKAGEYRSCMKRYNVIRQLDTSGNIKGRSIYVGQSRTKSSKNGNYFVRFYDKYAESKNKSVVMPKEVEDVTTGDGTHIWQRYEIQFNKGKAQHVVDQILAAGSFAEVYMGVMRNIVEFLSRSKKDVNKSRWQMCKWWQDFLQGAQKCKLSDPERDLDLGRLLHWLRVAVVPSLHLLQELGKERGFDIYRLIDDCRIDDYPKKQKRLLNNAKKMPDNLIQLYLREFLEGYGKGENQ